MAWQKWSIWSFILSRLAKAQGFLDPTVVFANLQRFAKPSEVWVPSELLRSGAILQSRGLINSQAIQHNLDWVWPFWVERQFDPKDDAFVPRAFSMTHINLTHRNWTAVGVPDVAELSIVDPRGLVTPLFDGWSVDAWIISEHFNLLPSRMREAAQSIEFNEGPCVATVSKVMGMTLDVRAQGKLQQGMPVCDITFRAASPVRAWLAICIRPYNPEGISFIRDIKRLPDAPGWLINGKDEARLNKPPFHYMFSNYLAGDVYDQSHFSDDLGRMVDKATESITCPVGMATAVAMYPLVPYRTREVSMSVPLSLGKAPAAGVPWHGQFEGCCVLKVPDQHFQFLYESALRTLILHSPGDVFPGPFVYKRFWFRDAAFILNAMLGVGLVRNIEKIIDLFPGRQTPMGYFLSQDGEWDSNGQAIWTMERYARMTDRPIKKEWLDSVYRGAKWIMRKRMPSDSKTPHAGLLPVGFSAEHFGPSDYYYWDDFWGVAGLKSAAALTATHGPDVSEAISAAARDLLECTERSLEMVKDQLHSAMPSSPYRRMDGGAIGSLAVSYPLQLWPAKDERVLHTVDFLMKNNFLQGCFYHEISHSGINAYMTLHVAQVLLRAGDMRFFNIVEGIAKLASPTGQWPEAIHPKTRGGCMGDGQHVWAAAEWVLMMRNMFVREEEEARVMVLCSGIPSQWLQERGTLSIGPVLTMFGKIFVSVVVEESIHISWEAQWYGEEPAIEVRLPGHPVHTVTGSTGSLSFKPNAVRPSGNVFRKTTMGS